MMTDDETMIIPMDDSPPRQRKRRKAKTGSDIVFLDQHGLPTSAPGSDTMVIPMPLDAKETKHSIISNWQSYSAKEVVKLLRQLYYNNTGTLSSQLSQLKSTLTSLPSPPPVEYLEALKLTRTEYRKLRDNYREKRDKEGFDLVVVHDADSLVSQALEMMTSSDFRVLWPAAVLCCGLRPVELLTCIFRRPQTKHGAHDGWWICCSKWAKKGKNVKDIAQRDFCRDHPLLCPSWLFLRAIGIIREHFNKDKLDKRQIHQRYSKYMMTLLYKGFPQLVRPTHVLLRRTYAKYSYLYFQADFPNVIAENTYVTWVLGHTSVTSALSYTNLHLRNAGKLKLFSIGKNLQVPAAIPAKPVPSMKNNHSRKKAPALAVINVNRMIKLEPSSDK
jgi:hypothetical protein